MANIKLKELLTEVEDFKARSKETGKLVHFKSKDSYNAALKAGTHEDPKDKKDKTPKASAKPNDMFGGDYAKDRGGEAPKADTAKAAPKADVKSIIKNLLKTADKEFKGVYKLKDIADDLNIDDTDGADGNMLQVRIDKGEDGTYIQTDETEGVIVFNDGSQYKLHHVEDGPIPVTRIDGNAPKSDVSSNGQTDDELYNALSDMGYDFGELGSDDFDEEGFSDAAVNLGYRWDNKNKVWNHRDKMGDAETSKSTPKINSKNWTPDEDDNMSNEASADVQKYLNSVLGADGSAEVDYNTGNIQYGLADSENSIFVGYADGKYNVSFEGPSMDLDKITQSYKSFKNPKEALQYAGELAKANREGLEQKQESTKLTSMIKR